MGVSVTSVTNWRETPTSLLGMYIHPRIAIDSSIGLNPSPVLNLAAEVGHKDVHLGCEVGFDTASASFIKYTAGISFNKPDLSAALILHKTVSQLEVLMLSIATTRSKLKTRFSDNGKVAMLCQREWRPKSLITLSAEYDTKKTEVAPKWGLASALKP
ncbi:hypothetical protein L1987_21138 [Smallanthus sonchifolius]|uniref:Uncharacterized protein n=1 Tax=Smallanthus sonchifolius TaxID=185202 RepID=A0ACB9IVN4_9ASTR|nr:hypothetical protein L1987_21138 [Smallanthus sonchifolius]